MLLSVLMSLRQDGRLPNPKARSDPSIGLPKRRRSMPCPSAEVQRKMKELGSDALLARVFADAKRGRSRCEEMQQTGVC